MLVVAGRDGAPVTLLPLALSTVLEDEAGVFDFQLRQTGRADLQLAAGAGRAATPRRPMARCRELLAGLRRRQGAAELRITTQSVDGLPLGRSGKLKRIVAAPAARPRSGLDRQQPAQHVGLLGGGAFAADHVLAVHAEVQLDRGAVGEARGVGRRGQRGDPLLGQGVGATLGGVVAVARGAAQAEVAAEVGAVELLAAFGRGRRAGLGGVFGQQLLGRGVLGGPGGQARTASARGQQRKKAFSSCRLHCGRDRRRARHRKGLRASISSASPGSSGLRGLPGWMIATWHDSAASTSWR